MRSPGPSTPESLRTGRLLRREAIAAVIAEPIQGNGGIIVPPDGYWPELRRLCTRMGRSLIADEIQTAWNRTGRLVLHAALGSSPDIVTVAKALGNGFPIAAYMTTDAIAAHYTRPGASTFGGNLGGLRAAALATLDSTNGINWGQRSASLAPGGSVGSANSRPAPVIAEVRGLGLMIGVRIASDRTAAPRRRA